ncbi:hypothetical protein MAHJHV55_51140 [Mycobacterium avium subsp. hominissuis]
MELVTTAPGVRLLITPASQAVYREALRRGYLQDLAGPQQAHVVAEAGPAGGIGDAGAVVTNSTCGACFGYHMGLLGAGEAMKISASVLPIRPVKLRVLAVMHTSPATVAASAVAGYITDPRSVTA